VQPAGVLGAAGAAIGRLARGGVADVCLFDPAARWTVQPQALRSQGQHTPFAGMELPGRVVCTLVAGRIAFDATR
jgi:dihydroorotase